MADQHTDKMYDALRSQWGKHARANGYQLNSFFLSEQAIVLSALQEKQFPIVDLACGSGLMVLPIATDQNQIFGLDFNADACSGARTLGLNVVRGDVFHLPFADDSVGQLVNCQFLNQQPNAENYIVRQQIGMNSLTPKIYLPFTPFWLTIGARPKSP